MIVLISGLFLNYSCKKELEESIIVKTGTYENLGTDTVTLNGQVVDPGTGITQYGHCWNKTVKPKLIGDCTPR